MCASLWGRAAAASAGSDFTRWLWSCSPCGIWIEQQCACLRFRIDYLQLSLFSRQAFAANLRHRSARVFRSRLPRVNYSTNETARGKKQVLLIELSEPGAMKSFKIMAADLYAHKLLGWWNQNFLRRGSNARKKSGINMRCVAVSRGVERKTG
jgi:hypothetical protein